MMVLSLPPPGQPSALPRSAPGDRGPMEAVCRAAAGPNARKRKRHLAFRVVPGVVRLDVLK